MVRGLRRRCLVSCDEIRRNPIRAGQSVTPTVTNATSGG